MEPNAKFNGKLYKEGKQNLKETYRKVNYISMEEEPTRWKKKEKPTKVNFKMLLPELRSTFQI